MWIKLRKETETQAHLFPMAGRGHATALPARHRGLIHAWGIQEHITDFVFLNSGKWAMGLGVLRSSGDPLRRGEGGEAELGRARRRHIETAFAITSLMTHLQSADWRRPEKR